MAWGLITRYPIAIKKDLVDLPSKEFNDERFFDLDKSLTYLLKAKLIVLSDDIKSIWHWSLLTRDFNGLRIDMNIDTNQMYLNNSMMKLAITT